MPRRLVITGAVQGVGYRHWMYTQAHRLGLTGWVRNRRDGSVEAVVDGPPEGVTNLIELARTGPPAARVSAVQTEELEGSFSRFELRPSA
jgi:acylphosphatase